MKKTLYVHASRIGGSKHPAEIYVSHMKMKSTHFFDFVLLEEIEVEIGDYTKSELNAAMDKAEQELLLEKRAQLESELSEINGKLEK